MTVHTHAKTQRPPCPGCGGRYVTRDSNDRYRCKACGRSFAADRDAPKSKGSGIIGEPVRGREFKPLVRLWDEHMRLAMETRK